MYQELKLKSASISLTRSILGNCRYLPFPVAWERFRSCSSWNAG